MGSYLKKLSDIPKSLQAAYNKPTLLGNLRAGGWTAFIDGNLACALVALPGVLSACLFIQGLSTCFADCRETALAHGPGGTLVGEDLNGNKYYERNTEQFGVWADYSQA